MALPIRRVPSGLKDYFRAAWAFPLRFITVSVTPCSKTVVCPTGSDTRVVLTQAKRQPMNGKLVDTLHYSVEAESLDQSCSKFPLTF